MAETSGPTAATAAAAVTMAVAQPEHVTVNVVTSSPASGTGKPSQEVSSTTKEPATATDTKPTTAPAANPEPTKTSTANPAPTSGSSTFKGKGDDFYNSIFYFSGMGSVIGSALAQGVYVSEQNRHNAIDPDDVSRKDGGLHTEQLVVSARGQAQNLSTDFHKLQSLLESLPIFTGTGGSSATAAGDRRELDQPIHGELYFSRCKERFPVQPSPTPTSGLLQQSGREAVVERPRSRPMEAEERGRRRHDDAVLDEVAKAAWEAFPLLPPTRGLGSSPGSSGRASRDRDGGAVSPAVQRRRRPAPAQGAEWSSETTMVDVKPWQMSHVRQYDVMDGYPLQRP